MAKFFSEIINTYGVLRDSILSKTGSLIGGLELSGVEPTSLGYTDQLNLTEILRNLFQRLPEKVTVSQYYWHSKKGNISFEKRDNNRSNLISTNRADFLNNERKLNSSRLYWTIEVPQKSSLKKIVSPDFLTELFNAIFDEESREKIKRRFKDKDALVYDFLELEKQLDALKKTLKNIDSRLSFVSWNNSTLSVNSIWGLQKTIATLNTNYLYQNNPPPIQGWDEKIGGGGVSVVGVDGNQYLKVEGENTVYARIITVKSCGQDYTPEAAWCNLQSNPVLATGEYLYFVRFKPITRYERNKLVSEKSQDLYRSQMKAFDFVKGNTNFDKIKDNIEKNERLKVLADELEEIKNSEDQYGILSATIVVFNTDLNLLKKDLAAVKTSLEQADFYLLFETVGLLDCYKSLFIGFCGETFADIEVTTSQASALSLIYKSNPGVPIWFHGAKKQEAVFVFENEDKTPFYYTPYIGDKCLVVGVGPTRSGKTFAKNCIATHFNKLGGMYAAMDIDQGTEPIAKFLKEDAKVFRLTDATFSKGFNPFAVAGGGDDDQFFSHLNKLIALMLATNDAPEMQTLTAQEQLDLEKAAKLTLTLGNQNTKNFDHFLLHCARNGSLKRKLQRFIKGGFYGNLFANKEDAIGRIDTPFMVYNTEGVKDNPKLAQLVNTEIFFRAVRLFENPMYREKAKFLEVDECQYVLSQPGAADFLATKARTWFKHGGGMGLWTQSPKHYMGIPEWSTIRSAATTFLFLADPEMESEEYMSAFPFLGIDECQTIKSLKPKQQMYIKQMDVGIAKIINLFVEPEQYVISTSRPHEAALRDKIFTEEKDIDRALKKTVKELGLGSTIKEDS